MKKIFLTVVGLVLISVAIGQDKEMQDKFTQANNPLAKLKMVSFQNNYTSSYASDPSEASNSMLFRWFQPVGRWLVSLNLPVTMHSYEGYSNSGIGGLNFFATYLFTKPDAPLAIAVGPNVTAPTNTGYESVNLGAFDNKVWSAGFAAVLVHLKNPQFVKVLVLQYDKAINPGTNQDVSRLTAQPILIPQVGSHGAYIRCSPIMTFDLNSGETTIPLGIGFGQILVVKGAVLNFYVEPQYTVYSNVVNAPRFNFSSGIILKFFSKE